MRKSRGDAVVRPGVVSFHATQMHLYPLLSEEDFVPDEEFMAEVAKTNERFSAVTNDLEAAVAARDSLPILVRSFKRLIAATQAKVDTFGQSEQFDLQLQKEREEKLKFHSDFNEMRNKWDKACAERDIFADRVRNLNQSLLNNRGVETQIKTEYDQLDAEFQQLKSVNHTLEESLEEVQRELSSLKVDYAAEISRADTSKLHNENVDLTKQLKTVKGELQQLKDSYAVTVKQNSDLTNKVDQQERELRAERRRVNPDAEMVAQLQQELAVAQSQVSMGKQSTSTAVSAVCKDSKVKLNAEIAQWKIECNNLKTARDKAENELKEVKAQKEARAQACLACDNANAAKAEAQSLAFENQQEIVRLRVDNDTIRKENNEIRILYHNLQKYAKDKTAEAAEYKNQLEDRREISRLYQPEVPFGTAAVAAPHNPERLGGQEHLQMQFSDSQPYRHFSTEVSAGVAANQSRPDRSDILQRPASATPILQQQTHPAVSRADILQQHSVHAGQVPRYVLNQIPPPMVNPPVQDENHPGDDQRRMNSPTGSLGTRDPQMDEYLQGQQMINKQMAQILARTANQNSDKPESGIKLQHFDESHPERINRWLLSVDQCKTANRWSDATTFSRVSGALGTVAFRWFSKLVTDNPDESWENF
ncbi:cingulin-like [Paramacrobiotus metropolitanus]|uniref:cingulin-like n=1 Tax=Paramacrobiotus metropolitanus TaxID=2943436 RepID=UPI0024460E02|nr:cingulin-like [Paramacrobiotus metropolitanus]